MVPKSERYAAAAQASLACEGMRLTAEEEALFKQFDRERLTPDQRRDRLLEFTRAQRRARAHAAE
jgi:hypothetical protein